MKGLLFFIIIVALIFTILVSVGTFYKAPINIEFCKLGILREVIPLPKPDKGCGFVEPGNELITECKAKDSHIRPKYDGSGCIQNYYCETCGSELIEAEGKGMGGSNPLIPLIVIIIFLLVLVSLKFRSLRGYAFSAAVGLIILGIFIHYGILNPTKFLPSRCVFGHEIQCLDYLVEYGNGSNGSISLRLKNNVGGTIIIQDWNVSSDSQPVDCKNSPSAEMTVNKGLIDDYIFDGCDVSAVGIQKDQKRKIDVRLNYYETKSGPIYQHVIQGEVFAKVKQP